MQDAETSKIMLPCWRRVHLHKSASLKTIFEQIRKNHKNDAKNYPKLIEKHLQQKEKIGKLSKHIPTNTPKFQISAPIWEPAA